MTRRDLQTIHEPFGDAYYYGPERMGARFEKDEETREKSGFAASTFKTILDRIDREASEVCARSWHCHPSTHCVALPRIASTFRQMSTFGRPKRPASMAATTDMRPFSSPASSKCSVRDRHFLKIDKRLGKACLHQRHHLLSGPTGVSKGSRRPLASESQAWCRHRG